MKRAIMCFVLVFMVALLGYSLLQQVDVEGFASKTYKPFSKSPPKPATPIKPTSTTPKPAVITSTAPKPVVTTPAVITSTAPKPVVTTPAVITPTAPKPVVTTPTAPSPAVITQTAPSPAVVTPTPSPSLTTIKPPVVGASLSQLGPSSVGARLPLVTEAVKLSHATGLPADSPSIQQAIAMPVLPTTSARVQQVAKELGLAPDNPDVQTAIRFSSITGLQPNNPELLKALGLLPYSQYTTPNKEGMTSMQGQQYYGANGSVATIGNNDTLSITDASGKTMWYQKHQNDNEHINTKTYKNADTNSTATTHQQSIVVQNDKGQTVATLHLNQPPKNNTGTGTGTGTGTIIDFYPPGLSKSAIPKMNEDLYILKTQLVPPVVPVGSACPLCDKPMKSANASSKACGCPNLGNQRAKHEKENCPQTATRDQLGQTPTPTIQDNMFTSSYDGAYNKSPVTKEQPFDYRTLPHTFDPIPMLNSFAKF